MRGGGGRAAGFPESRRGYRGPRGFGPAFFLALPEQDDNPVFRRRLKSQAVAIPCRCCYRRTSHKCRPAIVRYATYAQHKMAGPVIGWAQVRHLYRPGEMCFRRSQLDHIAYGLRCRHRRRDIGLHGWQILRSRARRERRAKHQHYRRAHIESVPRLPRVGEAIRRADHRPRDPAGQVARLRPGARS
jgi:hypothetical protein